MLIAYKSKYFRQPSFNPKYINESKGDRGLIVTETASLKLKGSS